MANGCKYDHLAVDYLPPHCIDDEVVDQFIHAGPGPDGLWDYYYDVEDAYYGRNAFYDLETVEALARNGTKYYCSPEWHAGHCLYLWWKIERGVVQMEWFDSTHGSHCMGFVMQSWRQIVQGDKPLPTCIAGQYRHQRDPDTGLMVRPDGDNDQCMELWRPGLPHNGDKK
ncbi:hypothetical protein KVR01_002122 [Diaporthe batatas]|uniref:uncharacterized protein n=1 Tax=Diaporthe batatas TaxID=748121 RepID=UPI001D03D4F1|nr:uncharacterized protein KVR01_002122 [Diaporthe batatas]KAG8166433.1 hypothetical protein KVR01_002122 [Diaporthe batatas]